MSSPSPSPSIIVHVATSEWGTYAEWATGAVAVVALVLSFLAYRWSLRAAKTSVFLSLQESLNGERSAQGRRLLYSVTSVDEAARLFRKRKDDWDKVNFAVNQLNTMARYARHGLIDEGLTRDVWGRAVSDAWPNLEWVVRFRRQHDRSDKWTSLIWFAQRVGVQVADDLLRRDE